MSSVLQDVTNLQLSSHVTCFRNQTIQYQATDFMMLF